MTAATMLLISLASLPPQAPPVRQCCPPQAPPVKGYRSVMADQEPCDYCRQGECKCGFACQMRPHSYGLCGSCKDECGCSWKGYQPRKITLPAIRRAPQPRGLAPAPVFLPPVRFAPAMPFAPALFALPGGFGGCPGGVCGPGR